MIGSPDPATASELARFYDLDLQDDPGDLDLYRALADRADGPILELAAGSGRLAVPLALAGHQVTAIDVDPQMLARARRRWSDEAPADGRLELIEADLVGLRPTSAPHHALAFLALNSIMLLPTRDAQREAFRTLAAHLRPGGIAAVDAWLPDGDDLARYDGRQFLEWIREDRASGTLVTKTGSAVYDAATAAMVLTATFDEATQGGTPRRWIRQDRLRLVSADELTWFAEDAGLRVEIVAGGYDLTPIGPGSERAIVIAERP